MSCRRCRISAYKSQSRSRAIVSATVRTPSPSCSTVSRPQAVLPQSVRCDGGLGISLAGLGSFSFSFLLPGLPVTNFNLVGFGRRPAIETSLSNENLYQLQVKWFHMQLFDLGRKQPRKKLFISRLCTERTVVGLCGPRPQTFALPPPT